MDIKEIVVCGLLTSACVLFTIQSGFARGFKTTLYEPGCGDRNKKRHKSTLENYDNYCFEVVKDLNKLFE